MSPKTDAAAAFELSTDGAAGEYRKIASDANAQPEERAAAELFLLADEKLENEEFEEGIPLAEEAVGQFRALQHKTGTADAFRLLVNGYRIKAESLRYGDASVGPTAVRDTLKAAEDLAKEHLAKARAAGDKRSEVVMLLTVADVNYNKRGSKKRDEAAECLELAKKLSQELGDKRLEACVLFLQSNILIKSKQVDASLAAADEAYALFRSIGDRKGEAKALHMLGVGRVYLNELEDAIKTTEQACAIVQELKLRKLEGFMLLMQAHYYISRQKGKEALPLAEDAMELFRERDYGVGYTPHGYDAVVQALLAKGEPKKAMQVAEEGLDEFERAQDKRKQAIALGTLVQAHLGKADAEEAVRTAEEAQVLIQELGDLNWEASLLREIAQIHVMRDSFEQASQAAHEAAALYQSLQDREGEALALNALTSVHLKRDDYRSAMEVASEQRDIFRDLGQKSREACCVLTVSGCLGTEARYEDALALAVEAQELFQEAKDKEGEARALNMMAEFYSDQQEYDMAVEKCREMRERLRETGDKVAEANALRVLSNINITFERPGPAVRAANEALALAKKAQNRKAVTEMLILVSQANLSLVMKDNPKALAKGSEKSLRPAKEAVNHARALGMGELLGAALYQLGKVQMLTMRLPEAMQAAREAVDICRQVDDRPGEAGAVILIAEIHSTGGQNDKALDTANEGLRLAQACGDTRKEWHANQLIEKIAGRRVVYEQVGQPGDALQPEQVAQAAQAPASQAVSSVAQKVGLDRELVQRAVQEMAKQAVGLDDGVFLDSPLMDSGMDSLSAVSFRNGLQQTLGVKLPSSLMFDYPTMKEVSERIVELSLEAAK